MKLAKAVTTSILCVIGWFHIIQGFKAEWANDAATAQKWYCLSFIWTIPAYILGIKGWNWKEAIAGK